MEAAYGGPGGACEDIHVRVFFLRGAGYLLGTMFDIEEQGLWCAHGDILVFRSPLHSTEEWKNARLEAEETISKHLSKVLRKDDALSAATFAQHRIYLTGSKLVPQSHIKGLIYNAKVIMSGRVSLAKKKDYNYNATCL